MQDFLTRGPCSDKWKFVIGTSIVLLATYLYSIRETSKPLPPPPIRIDSYENIIIDRDAEEGNRKELSIKLPSTPLKIEEALSTSRPASPNPKYKRKGGESVGHFPNHLD